MSKRNNLTRRRSGSSPLPRCCISLAQIYIEANDPKLNKRAIAYLNDALRTEDKETQGWHLLATAYGRGNQIGMAALALSEEGRAGGKKKEAQQQALRAKAIAQELPRLSPRRKYPSRGGADGGFGGRPRQRALIASRPFALFLTGAPLDMHPVQFAALTLACAFLAGVPLCSI